MSNKPKDGPGADSAEKSRSQRRADASQQTASPPKRRGGSLRVVESALSRTLFALRQDIDRRLEQARVRGDELLIRTLTKRLNWISGLISNARHRASVAHEAARQRALVATRNAHDTRRQKSG